MTSLWRHNEHHVQNTKNSQKSPKSQIFAIFVSKICTYVVGISARGCPDILFMQINSNKYKHGKYMLTKTWKSSFLCISHWKYRQNRNFCSLPSTFDGTPWPRWRWYLWFFFAKMTAKDELTTTYKRLVKYLGVLVQSEKIYRGGHRRG